MSLTEKLINASAKSLDAAKMSDVDFNDPKYTAPCHQMLFNVLFSGKLYGGVTPGLHMLAGASKSGKCHEGSELVNVEVSKRDGTIISKAENVEFSHFYETVLDVTDSEEKINEVISTHKSDLVFKVDTPSGWKEVRGVVKKEIQQIVEVTYKSESKIFSEKVAAEHNFFTLSGNPINACDLQVSSFILGRGDSDEKQLEVIEVKNVKNDFVYGLSMDFPHVYYAHSSKPALHKNTQIGLNVVKDYLDHFPDAVCVFYDTEYGGGHSWEELGIDTSRVIHCGVQDVEEWKFDFMQKKKEIKKGDHVIFFVDSLGMMGSKKEREDAENEKSVSDMSRAKAIKSALRLMTPALGAMRVPMICINHTGQEIGGFFPKEVQTGGQAATLAPQTVVFFGKSALKDGNSEAATSYDNAGFTFKLKINKSRTIKEGTVLDMPWKYGEKRPWKYTGIYQLMQLTKISRDSSRGWREMDLINQETGEIELYKFRESTALDRGEEGEEFYKKVFEQTDFIERVSKKLMY